MPMSGLIVHSFWNATSASWVFFNREALGWIMRMMMMMWWIICYLYNMSLQAVLIRVLRRWSSLIRFCNWLIFVLNFEGIIWMYNYYKLERLRFKIFLSAFSMLLLMIKVFWKFTWLISVFSWNVNLDVKISLSFNHKFIFWKVDIETSLSWNH